MGIIPRFGVFGDVGNGRECPVYRGFVGLGVVLGCARGVLSVGDGGPCWGAGGWALLCLFGPF